MIVNTNQGKRHYGNYRGEVLAHGEHGKCKIFVPSVFPETFEVDDLPDAEPAAEIMASGIDGSGEYTYPALKSIVWVFFEAGDQNRPVYWAMSLGGQAAKQQYERVRGTPRKHVIKAGDTDIMIDESGIITVVTKNKVNVITDNEVNITTATMNISANMNILGNVMVTGNITGTSNIVSTGGAMTAPGDIMSTGGDVKAGSISLKGHTHISASPGSSTGPAQ